ncbi:hypothetical protein BST81_18155 [Leptolyngbya sp. 'hensonii']|uniref:hypothetical protein n=1 Tax=Leptolyngbya sp. 'hensonii' TaxID=1922337 RepID=UPI00094FC7B7|nr:hypothetical protein [Leptolyngbya sp. 'hensonii']OLP16917.1 hypothetical protein BST81_18155 [Leptolyngbya sp. 'hensonii']
MQLTLNPIARWTLLSLALLSSPAIAATPPKTTPPRSLTAAEIKTWKRQMLEQITNDLELSGLGKQPFPPFYPAELTAYRARWARINPEAAPFLGLWVNHWNLFPPEYALTVFPSKMRGQICIVAYQNNQYADGPPVPGEEVPPNPPPRLSVIKLTRGQGVGNGLWVDRTLIIRTKRDWMKDWVEVLGVVKPQKQIQIYASQGIARFNGKPLPNLEPPSPTLIKQLQAAHCTDT